jgi:calcineurin-like phosphoesterase family protein
MDFFISDTHFGHKNAIRYCNRPFRTVDEMNESMIERWNSTVTDRDRVFVLGDVFIMDPAEASKIIKSLNGYKILIAGNHDRSEKTMLECGFDEYHRKYEYNISGLGSCLLIHYPVPDLIIESLGYDFSIHGHIHNEPKKYGLKLNVAVDLIEFTPISLDDVIEDFTSRRRNSQSTNEKFSASINNGILEASMKIRMEDFSGAVDHIYSLMRGHWPERKK